MGEPHEATTDDPTFEQALERLEDIVDRLEAGELPLEEALEAFEEGVALSRRCAGELDGAEQRIEALVREGGLLATRAFDAGDGAGEDEGDDT